MTTTDGIRLHQLFTFDSQTVASEMVVAFLN
jgi:hypothetical protein